MNRIALAFTLLVNGGLGALNVQAEVMGNSSLLDKRIQTAIYSPDEVYRIQTFVGRASLIQFPPNETVNQEDGLMMSGDPQAWQMGVNKTGNRVGIKPLTLDDPDTNLIINTNRNTYIVELKLVKKKEDMTYLLRFTIPEKPKPPVAPRVAVDPCPGLRSGPYNGRGDKSVAPLEAWDNGVFTCFRFPTNMPRPVVYQVLPDGTETVANTRPVDDMLVVHGLSGLFRLRLNTLVMEVKPTRQLYKPYNFSGTTTGEVREVKRVHE